MNRISVNRLNQRSHVLSVRLTDKELKGVEEIVNNYGYREGSLSANVRVLFRMDLLRSRKWRDDLAKERESKAYRNK
jgi:hypothetical protein